MKSAALHPNEQKRIESLVSLNILDTLPEKDFDEITFLASQICNSPIALISLVDDKRQWFKSRVGLSAKETSKDLAFCSHAILQDDVFIIPDSSKDDRFFDNPLAVDAPHVQFYAGAPLLSPDGMPIGTICVIDSKPRNLTREQIAALKALSNQVTRLLELRIQITDLKKLHAQQIVLESQLAESSRLSALGEMAAGIAHEINNPLTVILTKTTLLKRKLESGVLDVKTNVKDFEIIENTVDRIAKVIRGLTTYSRKSDNDEFEIFSLFSIIDNTLSLCNEKFRYSCIEVKINCDPNLQIYCMPNQISQIFMNLLLNSYDAILNLSEKWIHIDVNIESDLAKIRFTDSGKDIPDLVAKNMMKPFYTTKAMGKGTGLGLSISSGLAKAHKGLLEYDSKSKNTCFILTLPLDERP